MTAAPDDPQDVLTQDGQTGPVDDARRPVSSSEAAPRIESRTDPVADRLRSGRRARQQARRQASAGRRRPIWAMTDGVGRMSVGLIVLAFVGLLVWIEIVLFRAPDDPAARTAADARSSRRAAPGSVAEAPTVDPAPTDVPWPPLGPEISADLREANGPVAGCTFHARLDDLRERLGTDLIGDCVEAPHAASHGETRQRTTRGELVWWDGEGRAVFANDTHTWITGPNGIVRRRNEERFAWESDADAGPRPTESSFVLPPALPGSVLPSRRIVSYYGNPLSSSMGILGEMPPEKLFPRLRTQAEAYRSADKERTVTPALELVAVVAQAQPGADGLYRLRMDTALIEQVASWADEHGFLLILDIQTGRGNVDDEVTWLLPFLKRPNVHLALDPEFAMPRDQVPGRRIGTMDAAAINGAQRILADLVESERLPPKLLVVHRFTEEMVTGYQKIATDPRVQVVMVMDGFGGPSIKSRQYDDLIVEQRVQYTGFKLFYRHDEPLMTPQQVLQLEPPPDLVIYQ
jgi:hypothetical protein